MYSKNELELVIMMIEYLPSTTLSSKECTNIVNTINDIDDEITLINYVIDVLLDTNASSSDVDKFAKLLS